MLGMSGIRGRCCVVERCLEPVKGLWFNEHTEETPDVCRSAYPTQRLHPRVQVLRVLGVGDEHSGPLLEPQVRETQQVVVEGEYSVPGDRCETDVRQM